MDVKMTDYNTLQYPYKLKSRHSKVKKSKCCAKKPHFKQAKNVSKKINCYHCTDMISNTLINTRKKVSFNLLIFLR